MKKQTFFGRWMQNSYLLFVFALVISLVVWVYMSFNSPNTETTFTIGDVPIQIELSEEARNQGLQAFTVDDPKATVTVSGNRTVLGLVNENDLLPLRQLRQSFFKHIERLIPVCRYLGGRKPLLLKSTRKTL